MRKIVSIQESPSHGLLFCTETFPDDGDIDKLRCLRILKEVGYDGMICPDHTPQNPDGAEQVMAYQYGYIRGLLQAVDQTG